jgi:allantoinase
MTTVRSQRVLLDGELRPATLRIEDGVFAAVGGGSADHDFGDLVVMPGLVDSHVHVNEPGRTEWEGFATATQAAIAGGTTTIVDMPLNSIPPTVDVPSLDAKRAAASASGISCDVAFWGGWVGRASDPDGLAAAGVSGFKAFLAESGVDEFPHVGLEELGSGLAETGRLGLPMLVHAEDPSRLRAVSGDPAVYRAYLDSRPVESEVESVAAVAGLVTATGVPAHILHVSSGDAAALIGDASGQLSGETCPHYLTFAAEEIPDGATEFKCAPPIRGSDHREALWEALGRGDLGMVVSDHSPSPPEMKTSDFATSWGGISSVQLRLPITWTGAAERGYGFGDLAEWLSSAPARLAGLDDRKGDIRVGADADIVVWDPDAWFEVDVSRLAHRHPISPYTGMRVRGRVLATWLRGQEVWSARQAVVGRGRMLDRR